MAATKKFKTTATSWLGVTMTEAIEYLTENGSDEDRKEFKQWVYSTKDGKPCKRANWGNARKKFLEKYYPEFLPQKKEKTPNISDQIKDW